jgi:hypothetical protein
LSSSDFQFCEIVVEVAAAAQAVEMPIRNGNCGAKREMAVKRLLDWMLH